MFPPLAGNCGAIARVAIAIHKPGAGERGAYNLAASSEGGTERGGAVPSGTGLEPRTNRQATASPIRHSHLLCHSLSVDPTRPEVWRRAASCLRNQRLGSEFKKYFDQALAQCQVTHWHPKSPQMSAHCERFNRTLREEFADYDDKELWDVSSFHHKPIGIMPNDPTMHSN